MLDVTSEHFQLFKSECRKWIDKLELNNWEVYFLSTSLKDVSEVTTNLPAYTATMCLCEKWDDSVTPLNDAEIKKAAKHEAIHLLTARLLCVAGHRYISESELYEAEHELVRKLEGFLQ